MRRIGAIILLLATLAAESADAADKSVLVVYDGSAAAGSPEGRAAAAMLNLLDRFECSATGVSADDYRAGQLRDYEAAIYLGLEEGAELSEALLADCYDSERPVYWLGSNLRQLADRFSLGRYGFRLASGESPPRPRSVAYQGRHYRRVETPLAEIVVTRPEVCRVLAVGRGEGEAAPYVIRSGDFWYFAEIALVKPEQGGSHLILCDQLREILRERHPKQRQALICITSVSAETEVGSLGTLISYLERTGVPFAISVVPVFRDPEIGRGVPLSRRRGLVGALRGAQAKGASIIAHGLNGQSPASERGQGDRPGPRQGAPAREALSDVRRRLERAIAELAKCGLYPVAWVRSEERMSAEEDAEIGAFCSTEWWREREDDSADVLPFLMREDGGDRRFIPDNLTHLRGGRGEVEVMLAEARDYAEVPEAWVTASIGPSAPLSALELLVRGLRQLGYDFTDLRSMTNWTQAESLHVRTVAVPRVAGELIPEGWGGTLVDPEGRKESRFERPGKDVREEVQVRPGALLLAYPIGLRPRPIFALEGGPQGVTNRVVYGIAQIIVFVGLAACAVLMVIYLGQVILQRRA